VLAGGADGNLYEFKAATGALVGTYSAGNGFDKAILLVGGYAYLVTDDGHLHKVAISGLTPAWSSAYVAGASAASLPAFSASRNVVIFATTDNYVHAVNSADGSLKWRVKPTVATPGPNKTYSFSESWPVVADQHGLVLMTLTVGFNQLFDYPSTHNIYPNTNATVRTWLTSNPQDQQIFPLSLDTGATAFIPATGGGYAEGWDGSALIGSAGSIPVVQLWSNGDEVAYTQFRNGSCNPPDGRWDGHMGEMELDSTTVAGLNAGDMRFVGMDSQCYAPSQSYTHVNDERSPLTMA